MNKREVLRAARSVRDGRVIGSVEYVKDPDESFVADVAARFNLGFVIEPEFDSGGRFVIVFYVPGRGRGALEQYLRYERSEQFYGDGKAAGLTPEEHYGLGLSFGFSPEEAQWFREEMEEELRS